ncbi:MAG: succinate dehydrogenase cytochrome b subunit [Chlorobi bacterium]|nr:succinate dehydrogenase cytochrome b subunit [Chlorobiota bacterium]
MSSISNWLTSSIGKKFIMALTGLLLILFLVVHLINNLFLFIGPDLFNENVARLDAIKPLIRVVEVILAILFIYHAYNALTLWWNNKKANPDKYAVNGSKENSTLYSRWMVITGTIILIFLFVHLSTLWATYNFGMEGSEEFYDVIRNLFSNPLWALFYFVIMILLGFHMNHAFQSAFQTMGWNHKKYFPLVQKTGTAIAVIFTIGFGSIPIYFFLLSLGGKG